MNTKDEHWVYRVHSASGCCLYVGRTCDPMKRWDSHCRTQVWAGEAADVAFYGPFTLAEAARREAEDIRDLIPGHNHSMNPLLGDAKRLQWAEEERQQAEVKDLVDRGIGLMEAWFVVDFRRREGLSCSHRAAVVR
jgi:hypothetical protein